MLSPRPYGTLGRFENDWLNAHYHFSFSGYHDPGRMGLGALRVINDDIVAAGGGFGFHPHQDMEIITYVREGAITHRDNLGNAGRTKAGDVQVMSAGTGIVHSEHNEEGVPTRLYQIWIIPDKKGVTPRWEARQFPQEPVTNSLPLLVSGRPQDEGKGALFIHQGAAIYGGIAAKGATLRHALAGYGYLLVSKGKVSVEGLTLKAGDGLAIADHPDVTLHADEQSELLLIDVPPLE